MKLLLFSLAILPFGFAIPTVETRSDGTKIHAVWYHDKIGARTSLTILDEKKTKTYAKSCSNSVKLGASDNNSITMAVNENGAGNITVGSTSHPVQYNPEDSPKVVCDSLYNKKAATVDCTILLPESFGSVGPATTDRVKCFDIPTADRLSFEDESVAEPVKERALQMSPAPIAADIKKRQAGQCFPYQVTLMDGDGNPHQNYRMNQISENIQCGTASACTVGFAQSKSVTVGWSAELSAAGWITGGFAVQTTWTSGTNYECQGSKGQTVCIRYKTAMTAYTVRNWYYDPCFHRYTVPGNPFVMWSPNQNNKGGGYMCATGSMCHFQGNGWWIKEGRAGGP